MAAGASKGFGLRLDISSGNGWVRLGSAAGQIISRCRFHAANADQILIRFDGGGAGTLLSAALWELWNVDLYDIEVSTAGSNQKFYLFGTL